MVSQPDFLQDSAGTQKPRHSCNKLGCEPEYIQVCTACLLRRQAALLHLRAGEGEAVFDHAYWRGCQHVAQVVEPRGSGHDGIVHRPWRHYRAPISAAIAL